LIVLEFILGFLNRNENEKMVFENTCYMIFGWILATAYKIDTYQYWVALFATLIAFEIRERSLRNNEE
jgi:hypothetical protein